MRQIILCDASRPEKVAPLCTKYGCGVEIQSVSNPDYPLENKGAVEEHSHLYQAIPLRSLHGPFGDLSPGSCDRLIREVTKKRFDFAYNYAEKLGVNHIVLHHGHIPNTNPPKAWLERSVEFWQDFLLDKDPAMFFYLENLLEPDPKLMADVLRNVNRPNLKACLDVGHAFCHSKLPIDSWIQELGELIGYVHLHDNLGDYDAHLSLGEGRLPLDEVCYSLERIAPEAIWALEVGANNLENSLFWLESHGYLPFVGG